MDTGVFVAVMAAAAMHAGWNSVIKVGMNRVATVLFLDIIQALIAAVLLFFVTPPDREAWGWIVAASCLHVGYKIFLTQTYAHNDLSQAYPLARGSAPLAVTVYSAFSLGVSLRPGEIAAILLISLGVLLMAFKGSGRGLMGGRALFYTMGTAAFIAAYTLVDGMGARLARSASGFFLWMVIGNAVGVCLFYLATRGPGVFVGVTSCWKGGAAAGVMSMAAYWITIWAFTRAPIPLVAALRESSILFAIVIAAVGLKERVTPWRWASAAAIACGMALMKI